MKPLCASILPLCLAACATLPLPPINTDYSSPTTAELQRASELRKRYDLPQPASCTLIYVDSVTVHHLYSEASTIVWKDQTGQWQWSQAVEVGPGGLLPVERNLEAHDARTLTADEADSLERLITNPELYSSSVRRTGKIGIGAPAHVMGIVTPFGRTTFRWDGRLKGPGGKVADIVLGHE